MGRPLRSALQTLHKVSSKAREHNYFLGGLTHDWVSYYEERIESDRSCLNEWHTMDSIESKRPPSPDSLRTKPREREETERIIRSSLKEIMMTVDLDEVTSKQVRTKLEEVLDMDLGEYKPFIDQEMLVILGQMDAATEIFPHVYLGSEWNASNLEELSKNGVCHILNVTREIDNFFPGMFDYLNVRVYDDEKTDLLKHWDDTFKYITKAKKDGSKVLVHCKMGVSRSASVVIAYAMKAYNWDMKKALEYVQKKRNCIKPNSSFISQLETYQGILDAMKNKEKLQRSKSETNLKINGRESSSSVGNKGCAVADTSISSGRSVSEGDGDGHQQTEEVSSRVRCRVQVGEQIGNDSPLTDEEIGRIDGRPKSWSPDYITSNALFPVTPLSGPTSASLERLSVDQQPRGASNHNINVRMPCGNGLAYSVSQNKIMHLPGNQSASVKTRVSALESANTTDSYQPNTPSLGRKDRKGLVLNLTSQFEESPPITLVKKEEPWDPGETNWEVVRPVSESIKMVGRKVRVEGDPFSNKLDRVFEREERKQRTVPSVVTEEEVRNEVSRQNSWSSYDSAVILRDSISRQSSWGSADTRTCTLPSRNSSWGSYDLRPNQSPPQLPPYEPYAIGTVKRTKQKLEENSDTVKRVCPDINNRICDDARSSAKEHANPLDIRSSTVVKEAASPSLTSGTEGLGVTTLTRRCVSVDESKLAANQGDSTAGPIENQKNISGMVKNLKKEFEAKSVSTINSRNDRFSSENIELMRNEENNRVRSLPSSPVSEKSEKPSPAVSLEDLSVRKLVGRYEDRPKLSSESEKRLSQPPIPPRKSSLDTPQPSTLSVCLNNSTLNHPVPMQPFVVKSNTMFTSSIFKSSRPPTVGKSAPPPSPSVVVASVVAKAASKKQQQGKTHPLARLTIKPRHNNPVYNTM